jgi:hypothetical protein
MKHGDSRGSSNTKEESVATDQSRVTPPRRLGRDAAGAVATRDNPVDRMSPAKATEGEGGGGTVVTVNGCPPKNSSVIYLTAESSPANRSANTGNRLKFSICK